MSTDAWPIPDLNYLQPTPRQIELLLWQILEDLGSEVCVVLPDDDPKRRVLFYQDRSPYGEYIGILAHEDDTPAARQAGEG